MGFLQTDVDTRLLLFIIFILAVFVSSSIYYQCRLENLQEEYDQKVGHLKELEEQLLLKEEKLNEISGVKDLLEKDKENLEVGYVILQDEKEGLEMENRNLTEESESKPFSKSLCKITGNVQCVD